MWREDEGGGQGAHLSEPHADALDHLDGEHQLRVAVRQKHHTTKPIVYQIVYLIDPSIKAAITQLIELSGYQTRYHPN